VTEQMIENMFVGRPPGNYDRLLDFSRAVTGTLFFVPSATFLESLNADAPAAAMPAAKSTLESAPSTAPAAAGTNLTPGSRRQCYIPNHPLYRRSRSIR
jgi:porphyrinogen peroxidase